MKRKWLPLLLVALTATLALAACGSNNPPDSTDSSYSSNSGNIDSGSIDSGSSDSTDSSYSSNSGNIDSDSSDSGSSDSGSSDKPETTYTVQWKDENGALLTTQTLKEGATPSYTYTKEDTAEWDYTVLGWSETLDGALLESLPTICENVTYYAKVSKVKQQYTVTYVAEGVETTSATLDYGTEITQFPTPTRDGYKFVCWCTDSALTTSVGDSVTVTGDVTYYAKWNQKIDGGALLTKLLSDYEVNPFSYIPETMTGTYSKNLVSESQIVTDYSSSISVNKILCGGFGEQWNMVLDNLHQSTSFFSVLSVVEGLTSASVTAFNNYLDSNPAGAAQHTFESGIYTVSIYYDTKTIAYVLDYTANLPVFGEQSVQIYLSLNLENNDRATRIQIGDANALHYTMTENSYTFAIKYLGVRRAYFSIARDKQGNCEGHIYEFLTISGVGTESAADFYITPDYVSVVGNKADAYIGFTGYINEVYQVSTGRMLGYEVRETLKSIVYNTLWFNLDQIDGITALRYTEATDTKKAAFYVNGSSTAWEPKNVGVVGTKMFSRRFDIEFRTQYFYSYDAATESYIKHTVKVPMFFVQEEYLSTLQADVKSTNNVDISLTIANKDLQKIQSDYKKLVDIFITNKSLVTEEIIIAFIGDRIQFSA